MMAATDALAAYRYEHDNVGKRFVDFVGEYFPPAYAPHAANLYRFRCRLLHNFSPAHFTLGHAKPAEHLRPSKIGDTILNDDTVFADLQTAAKKYFADVAAKPDLQTKMVARISDVKKGGAIFF